MLIYIDSFQVVFCGGGWYIINLLLLQVCDSTINSMITKFAYEIIVFYFVLFGEEYLVLVVDFMIYNCTLCKTSRGTMFDLNYMFSSVRLTN